MYRVRFSEAFKAEAVDYEDLVEEAIRQGQQRIMDDPRRALKSFSLAVTDEAQRIVFEVVFCRLDASVSSH